MLSLLHSSHWEDSRPVLLYRGVQLTRGELFARAEQFAAGLSRRGLLPGDRVGLSLANPAIYLTCMLGLARVQGVGVPVPAAWLDGAADKPMAALKLSWLVHDQPLPQAWASSPLCATVSARELFMGSDPEPLPTLATADAEDTAYDRPWLLARSSGTTGQAKTVVISQAAMCAGAASGEQFQPTDRALLFLDMSMSWAMLSALRLIRCGGLAVLQPPVLLPGQLLQTLVDHQVNVLVLSADAASKLASYLTDFADRCPSLRLTRVLIGGGRVSAQVMNTLHRHWQAQVVVLYGSTEMGPVAIWRQQAAAWLTSESPADAQVLSPYAGVTAQVVDAMGQPQPAEEVGYLRLQSKAMFSGYLDADGGLPAQAPEWFYPGDLASMTMEGAIRLQGRADHVLNLGGRKVDPEQIETRLRDHPLVADAAVAMAEMGAMQIKVLVALLVLKQGADLPTVEKQAAQLLPTVQRPQYWAAVAALPRNTAGKLQRQTLAQMVRIERS